MAVDTLQEKIQFIPPTAVKNSCFLHRACSNANVTVDIIECLLNKYPGSANILSSEYGSKRSSYPLHLACINDNCPSSIIELLVKENPLAASTQSLLNGQIDYSDGQATIYSCYWNKITNGLPLHMYLSRQTNIELDCVKLLVEAYPEALTTMNTNSTPYGAGFTPINTLLVSNSNINDLYDVAQYMIESNSSSLQFSDSYERTPLHIACGNMSVTPKVLKPILRCWPQSARRQDSSRDLPLHILCKNGCLDEAAAMGILKLLLDEYPESAHARGFDDSLPIHLAATEQTPGFCKMLVDLQPDSVVVGTDLWGQLPIHRACGRGRLDTIEYLFQQYPGSIQVRDNHGFLPIHVAAQEKNKAVILFLLRHDSDGASRAVSNHGRMAEAGCLPLHLASKRTSQDDLSAIRVLFDAYPEAICITDGRGLLPANLARKYSGNPHSNVIFFLDSRLSEAQKATDGRAMTPDRDGCIALHYAGTLGAVKLLLKANPAAVRAINNKGQLPVHTVCEFGTVGAVRYLVDSFEGCLNLCDARNDSPLHHACRGGDCDVVKYLLGKHVPSVSERNGDNKLPIHLLSEYRGDNLDSANYVETLWLLLRAHPETCAAGR